MYYDRQGNAITLDEWEASLEHYRRVAETTLPDGSWVSTVWIGLDHGFQHDKPLIFETMVFGATKGEPERDCQRYATEAEARVGHILITQKWMDQILSTIPNPGGRDGPNASGAAVESVGEGDAAP